SHSISSLFFFFQAEDGIRARNVTGVQTCALPILRHSFQMKEEADAIEQAVNRALDNGYHTVDLDIPNGKQVGTKEMTEIVIENLTNKSVANCILSTYA